MTQNEECLFCKIAGGQTQTQLVYEDELVSAFNDIHPKAPVHILVVPKRHIGGLTELTDSDGELIGHIYSAILKIAKERSIFECGFRVVVNSGVDAGQVVEHLHFHILGGTRLKTGL